MASLRDLHVGDEVLAESLPLDPALVDAYLEAVGDTPSMEVAAGARPVPPLAVVALALRQLLGRVELPEGTVHTGQSLRASAAAFVGDELSMRWTVSRASSRADAFFVNLDLLVARAQEPVVEGRVSLAVPGAGA